MYAKRNPKTKKAFKEMAIGAAPGAVLFPAGPYEQFCGPNGTMFVEGPHYPAPHTWYAQVTVRDGAIVRVK